MAFEVKPPGFQADAAAVKAQAQDVPRQLETIISGWSSQGRDQSIHILFAELYLCTTRTWLTRLDRRSDSDYAYLVIVNFLDLFHEFVVQGIANDGRPVPDHWSWYRRLSLRLTQRSALPAQLVLVLLGARAHTHYDLGLAMVKADLRLDDLCTAPVTRDHAMFGTMSSDAFYHAALEFVHLQCTRRSGRSLTLLRVVHWGLIVTKPAWLLIFQGWRRSGYRKARVSAARLGAVASL